MSRAASTPAFSAEMILPLHPIPTAFMVDLDGTLVDTLGDFVAVLNRVMADMALPPVERDFVEHTIGQGSEHLIRSVLADPISLEIRGEYYTGPDEGALDTVVLTAGG